jgi:D-threo-aldose 1-dehydrogenase
MTSAPASSHDGDRPVGSRGLTVPRLLFGTAPLASVFWGNDEDTAVAAVGRALALGVRGFDTAPLYGLGEAEARLGRALAAASAVAEVPVTDVIVATKVGRSLVERDGERDVVFDFGADATRRQLDASLARLGRDRVDVAHVHDPEDHLAEALSGTVRALVELREEGVIRAVSVGTNVPATLTLFLREADLDCALLAGRWTLLDRTGGAVLDECAERGVPVLAGGVFNSGLLAAPRPGAWFDYAPADDERLRRTAELAAVCARHGTDLRTAAVQFPLRHPAVAAVVLGMGRPIEVEEDLASLAAPLPDDLWAELG